MALEYISSGELWSGEAIGGVRHPSNIESLWTESQLEAIGLRVRAPVVPTVSLADAKAAKLVEAWERHTITFANSIVNVNVGGAYRAYGCDDTTRENMIAIVNAITAAPSLVPNPRPFTPKGASEPVMTTHAEFIAIYLAGLAKGDLFYQHYASLKAAINAMTSVAEVQAFDVTNGWPA